MKIGMVALSGIYPIDIGGPASVGYFLAKWLGNLGDDVTLLIRIKDREQADAIEKLEEFNSLENINIIPIVMNYNWHTLVNFPYLVYKFYEATNKFSLQKFDVIHYNSPPVDVALLFPIVSKRKRKKQTLVIHGGLFTTSKNIIGRSIINIERDLFDGVIVLNNYSRNLAIKAGFKEKKIITIPNGVELEAISESKPLNLSGEPKILYVGVLTKIKDVSTLLHAFNEVVKQFPRACLYIVGDGPLRGFLERIAKELKIRDNVMFEGFIPTKTVFRYYKSVDLLVLPSLIENFSITLLEAMASKVPIIASDAEGNLELISNRTNGIVFRKGDYRMLGEKIQLLLDDPDFAQKLTINAYQDVKKKYNWKIIGHLYHDMFQSLLT